MSDLMERAAASGLLEARLTAERISSMDRLAAVNEINKILYQASLYRGQAPDGQMLAFTSKALVEEILKDTKYGLRFITIPEIDRVIKEGVLHRDMYVSVATIFSALVEYAKEEGHQLEVQFKSNREEAVKALPNHPKFDALIEKYTNKLAAEAKI